MKRKFVLFVVLSCLLTSCQKQNNNSENYSQEFAQKNGKTAIEIINQAIDDINNESVDESISLIVPVDIDTITKIDSIDECTPTTDAHSNAAYIGVCPVNDTYEMEISIYSLDEDFWNNGSLTFHVKQVAQNIEQYSQIKTTLDNLLYARLDTLDHLFGHDVQCSGQIDEQGYCLVTSDGESYIQELKDSTLEVFAQSYLDTYQDLLFDSQSAVWIIKEDGLYVNNYININYNLLNYDTSSIIATSQIDNQLIVNLCAIYSDVTDTTVHQIILQDDGQGYRLLTMQ